MSEFQKWWDETYGQILTITNDLDADASCRIAKIAAMDAWKSGTAALEAERDALRKSVDQLADTLKNVHESVCATLGIEGDDALPELVADWADGEYAALQKDSERLSWLEAQCGVGAGTHFTPAPRRALFIRFPVLGAQRISQLLREAIDAAVAKATGAQS